MGSSMLHYDANRRRWRIIVRGIDAVFAVALGLVLVRGRHLKQSIAVQSLTTTPGRVSNPDRRRHRGQLERPPYALRLDESLGVAARREQDVTLSRSVAAPTRLQNRT